MSLTWSQAWNMSKNSRGLAGWLKNLRSKWIVRTLSVFFIINLTAADFVQMSLLANLRLCMYFSCTQVTMKMELPLKYEEKQNACL